MNHVQPNKFSHYATRLREFLQELSWLERLFFCSSLFMAVGFLHFDIQDVYFAKLGLPIPTHLLHGGVPHTAPKLFITEIYLFFLLLLLGFSLAKGKVKSPPITGLLGLILLYLVFGLARMAGDFRLNPMLGLRNACFIWYLSIPILVYLLPVRAKVLESLFFCIQVLAFVYLCAGDLPVLFSGKIQNVYWIPFVGIVAPVAYSLITEKKYLAHLILLSTSLNFALGLFQGLQRTTLLGLLIALPGVYALYRKSWRRISSRLGLLLVGTGIFFSLVWLGPQLRKNLTVNRADYSYNPLVKSRGDNNGIEKFRKQMWQDAWQLFLAHPLSGIGFQQQVVYRIYYGDPVLPYLPNDGTLGRLREDGHEAPVSGPHNSYLNALVRLGIFGILILGIHLWGLKLLFRARLWSGFFLLYSGILYACFNIGLEGPIRSFFLLLALGLCLKIAAPVSYE